MKTQIKERNGIRVGETYRLEHWKGKAVVDVLSIRGEWIEVKIIIGHLSGEGGVATLSERNCVFTKIETLEATQPQKQKPPVTITHNGTTLNLTWRESASLVSSLLDAILDRKPCEIEV